MTCGQQNKDALTIFTKIHMIFVLYDPRFPDATNMPIDKDFKVPIGQTQQETLCMASGDITVCENGHVCHMPACS